MFHYWCMYVLISLGIFSYSSCSQYMIKRKDILLMHQYDLAKPSSLKTIQKFVGPEDYSPEDSIQRYLQKDLLRYADHIGTKIEREKGFLCSVPDKALYGKNFNAFKTMPDEQFIKEWPLFIQENKNTISDYIYGNKIEQCEYRLKEIRLKKFSDAYVPLGCNMITKDVAQNFLNDHKEIIQESSQNKDPLSKILLQGLESFSGKIEEYMVKSFIIYAVAHEKYELLAPYKNRCHPHIQKCIKQSVTISQNEPKIPSKVKTASSKTDLHKPKIEKSAPVKKKPITKQPQEDVRLKSWREGIDLLKNKREDDAIPYLLKNIEYIVSQGSLIQKKDRQFLYEQAQSIIKGFETFSDTQESLLYVYGKIAQKEGANDNLDVATKLWKARSLKGLLLKISYSQFIPSLYYGKKVALFVPFYNKEKYKKDSVIEGAIVKRIKELLQSDPHAIFFLLDVMPFAQGLYKDEFVKSFCENEKNRNAILTYNVIAKNIPHAKEDNHFFQKKDSSDSKMCAVIRSFGAIIYKYLEWTKKNESNQDGQMGEKNFIANLEQFLDLTKESNKKITPWIEILKHHIFRLGMSMLNKYDTDLGRIIQKLDVTEYHLKRILDNTEVVDSIDQCPCDSKNFYDQLLLLLSFNKIIVKEDKEQLKISKEELQELNKMLEKRKPLTSLMKAQTESTDFQKRLQQTFQQRTLHIDLRQELQKELQESILQRIFSGPKRYFELLLDKTRVAPMIILKMREAIVHTLSENWESEFQKIKESIELDPLIYAVLATDVQDKLRTYLEMDGDEIFIAHDTSRDIKKHFNYVHCILEKALKGIIESEFMGVYYNLFERCIISLKYLAETKMTLKPIIAPILEDLIEKAEQIDPLYITNSDLAQKKELFIPMLLPFGNNFEEFKEAAKRFLERNKRKKRNL